MNSKLISIGIVILLLAGGCVGHGDTLDEIEQWIQRQQERMSADREGTLEGLGVQVINPPDHHGGDGHDNSDGHHDNDGLTPAPTASKISTISGAQPIAGMPPNNLGSPDLPVEQTNAEGSGGSPDTDDGSMELTEEEEDLLARLMDAEKGKTKEEEHSHDDDDVTGDAEKVSDNGEFRMTNTMRTPLIVVAVLVTVLTLAGLAFVCWHKHQRIRNLKASKSRIEMTANGRESQAVETNESVSAMPSDNEAMEEGTRVSKVRILEPEGRDDTLVEGDGGDATDSSNIQIAMENGHVAEEDDGTGNHQHQNHMNA